MATLSGVPLSQEATELPLLAAGAMWPFHSPLSGVKESAEESASKTHVDWDGGKGLRFSMGCVQSLRSLIMSDYELDNTKC
eukprot:scaffold63642_cov19-Tisochrysis_lutea.AAC.1